MSSRAHPDTEAPFHLHKEKNFLMPLSFILALLASTALGVKLWTTTSEQVTRNTTDIGALGRKVETDHDLLLEIRADLKNLVRAQRRDDRAP